MAETTSWSRRLSALAIEASVSSVIGFAVTWGLGRLGPTLPALSGVSFTAVEGVAVLVVVFVALFIILDLARIGTRALRRTKGFGRALYWVLHPREDVERSIIVPGSMAVDAFVHKQGDGPAVNLTVHVTSKTDHEVLFDGADLSIDVAGKSLGRLSNWTRVAWEASGKPAQGDVGAVVHDMKDKQDGRFYFTIHPTPSQLSALKPGEGAALFIRGHVSFASEHGRFNRTIDQSVCDPNKLPFSVASLLPCVAVVEKVMKSSGQS